MTDFPEYGSTEWKLFQYNAAKEAKRGHNYAYYSDELGEKLKASGYQWHEFTICNPRMPTDFSRGRNRIDFDRI